ncbi:MAG: DUF1801 domain-containing protein [Chitinophagales bacterium]
MAEIKTKPTKSSVASYLNAVSDAQRKQDAKQMDAWMEEISGEKARLWGPSIIGYGSYHYKYDSGHEGDMPRLAFSPRKNALVLYLMLGAEPVAKLLKKLGKYKSGKGCLYLRSLEDVDTEVLRTMISTTLKYMNQKYPTK